MLKQRILTALILVPIVLLLFYYLPPAAFCFFTGLIVLLGAFEWTNLMGVENIISRFIYLGLMISAFFMALFIPVPLLLVSSGVWWVIALLLLLLYPRASSLWGSYKI